MKFSTLSLTLVAGASAVAAFPHVVESLAIRTYQTKHEICGTGMSVSYIVQSMDTLTRIALSLSSGICDIARDNRIENVDLIFPNQTLIVPVKLANPDNASCLVINDATATCVTNGPATYTVDTNEIFKTIAKKLGITTESLLNYNPGVDQFTLVKGDVLKVPVCPATPTVASIVPSVTPNLRGALMRKH